MEEMNIHIRRWPGSHPPSERELSQILLGEGLRPQRWSNGPGDIYDVHAHAYHKVIFVVSGSITFGFQVEGEPAVLRTGDRLDLPAGMKHNAVVGPDGVICLEAHRPA